MAQLDETEEKRAQRIQKFASRELNGMKENGETENRSYYHKAILIVRRRFPNAVTTKFATPGGGKGKQEENPGQRNGT